MGGGQEACTALQRALARVVPPKNLLTHCCMTLPPLPSRRQQEKGVITGSAVRYRTDDRVGAVSAAQVWCAAMIKASVADAFAVLDLSLTRICVCLLCACRLPCWVARLGSRRRTMACLPPLALLHPSTLRPRASQPRCVRMKHGQAEYNRVQHRTLEIFQVGGLFAAHDTTVACTAVCAGRFPAAPHAPALLPPLLCASPWR